MLKCCIFGSGWNRPDPWTGPAPVFYVSFDNASHLALMEATLPASFPLTTGQVTSLPTQDRGSFCIVHILNEIAQHPQMIGNIFSWKPLALIVT